MSSVAGIDNLSAIEAIDVYSVPISSPRRCASSRALTSRAFAMNAGRLADIGSNMIVKAYIFQGACEVMGNWSMNLDSQVTRGR